MKLLTRTCRYCSSKFQIAKKDWDFHQRQKKSRKLGTDSKGCRRMGKFCSRACTRAYQTQMNTREFQCDWCQTTCRTKLSQYKRSERHFCNSSCAAKYNNRNKTTGHRRSKIEMWMEKELRHLFPKLQIQCNDRSVLSYELDFYFPELQLAVEIQGVHHFQPIYGAEKLASVQENDAEKKRLCRGKKIKLLVVDIQKQKRFTPEGSKRYLKKVVEKIQGCLKVRGAVKQGSHTVRR